MIFCIIKTCFNSFHNHITVVVSPALLISTKLRICMLESDDNYISQKGNTIVNHGMRIYLYINVTVSNANFADNNYFSMRNIQIILECYIIAASQIMVHQTTIPLLKA